MINTRFQPTTNGNIHLGHLYLALLNYHTAKNTGGRFIVRFDDDQKYWKDKLGKEKNNELCEQIKEDLKWVGLVPDLYSYTSQEKEKNEESIKNIIELDYYLTDKKFIPEEHNEAGIKNIERSYPYVPYLTAIKVVQDWREGINLLIRGDDLATEFSLYCYFCRCLDIPIPKHLYVPKLMQKIQGKAGAVSDLSDVSKTIGNFKIRDLREQGYSVKQIIGLLEDACLVDKLKGWDYENIKKNPLLDIDEM